MSRLTPANAVQETSTTTGTGSYTLAGAVAGYRTVLAGIGNGKTASFRTEAVDANGVPTGDYEEFEGTLSSGTTLSRDRIYESSNSNNPVNWGAGTKRVFITPVAQRQSWSDSSPSGPQLDQVYTITGQNTGDTDDMAAKVSLTLSGSSATSPLILYGQQWQVTNSLTGGGNLQYCRIYQIGFTGSANTETDNLDYLYLYDNGTTGTVTTGRSIYIDGVPGANKVGIAVAGLYTGATKSALLLLGSGNVASDLPAGNWGIYSVYTYPSFFGGPVNITNTNTAGKVPLYTQVNYTGTVISNYVQNQVLCYYYPTTALSNPYLIGHYGFHEATLYGFQGDTSSGVLAASNSAIGYCSSVQIKWCNQYEAEHAPALLQITYDNNNNNAGNTSPGRGWLIDGNIMGAIETQQSALGGIHCYIRNHYNGVPRDAGSGAFWAVTAPGSGASTDDYHVYGRNYPINVGFGVTGFSNGGTSRGFETAFRAGGSGSNWQNLFSRLSVGLDVSDYDNAAIYVRGMYSGIIQIYVTAGGSGYTSQPTVSFGGSPTQAATATAELTATTVSRTASTNLVTTAGSGYAAGEVAVVTYSTPTPWGAPAVGKVTADGSGNIGVGVAVVFGSGASATATTSGGKITALSSLTGGTGYPPSQTNMPVTFEQSGNRTAWGYMTTNASGVPTAVSIQTQIGTGSGYSNGTVNIEATGTGYTRNPSATAAAPAGGGGVTPVIGTVPLQATSVSFVKLAELGFGYTAQPAISFSGGAGSGAEAFAVIQQMQPLTEIKVSNPGSGYPVQNPSAVVIGTTSANGGLTTGTAPAPTATVSGGVITAFGGTATGGSGFLPNQSPGFLVRLVGGTSAARNATALVTTNASGGVASATLKSGGSGYTNGETLHYVVYADADAIVTQGRIVDVFVKNGGAGVVTSPTVTLNPSSPTGVTATGTVTVSGGAVQSVTMTNKGSSYWAVVPTVTFNDPGSGSETGARGVAVVSGSGEVVEVIMQAGGSGYTGTTTVTFSAPPSGVNASLSVAKVFGGASLIVDDGGGDVVIGTTIQTRIDTRGNLRSSFNDSSHGFLRHYDAVTSAAATLQTVLGVARTVTSAVAATNQKDARGEWLRISATANNADSSLAAATFTLTRVDFDPIFVTRVQIPTAIVNMRVFMGLFSAAAVMTTDTQNTIHSVYLRFSTGASDTTWKLCTSNASSTTVVDTGVTVAINTRYDVRIDCTDASNIRCYINGALVATATATLPTSSTNLGPGHYLRSLSASGQKDLDSAFTAIYE